MNTLKVNRNDHSTFFCIRNYAIGSAWCLISFHRLPAEEQFYNFFFTFLVFILKKIVKKSVYVNATQTSTEFSFFQYLFCWVLKNQFPVFGLLFEHKKSIITIRFYWVKNLFSFKWFYCKKTKKKLRSRFEKKKTN